MTFLRHDSFSGPLLPPPVVDDVLDEEPVELWTVQVEPKITHQVQPEYPSLAIKAGIEDKVLVKVLIGPDGKVRDAVVMRGKEMFRASALEAFRQYVFTPALQNDKPVSVWMAMPIQFVLR